MNTEQDGYTLHAGSAASKRVGNKFVGVIKVTRSVPWVQETKWMAKSGKLHASRGEALSTAKRDIRDRAQYYIDLHQADYHE